MKRPLSFATAALLALGLASCAASAPASEGGDAPVGSAPEAQNAPPLTAFLEEMYGLDLSVQERNARELAALTEIEDLIAACMREAGFDYTPHVVGPDATEPGVSFDGVADSDLDDRAWVTRYGYGIVETPDRAPGERPDYLEPTAGDDPNAAYVDSLTPSEQAAYDEALSGEPLSEADVEAGVEGEIGEQGCWGRAAIQVRGEDPRDMAEFEPLFQAIDDFRSTAAGWEGAGELEAEWAACMAEQGRAGYSRQTDGAVEIGAEEADLVAAANPGDDLSSLDLEAPPAAALEELATRERELALVDLDCREDVDYRSRMNAIAVAAEERFMADHETDIAALRAAYEQRAR